MKIQTAGFLMTVVTGLLLCGNLFFSIEAQSQETMSDVQPVNQMEMHAGRIDAVNEEMVVINDMASPPSSVTVYDLKGFRRDISSLVVGQYVAFKRVDGGMVIQLVNEKAERPNLSDRAANKQVDTQQKEAIRQVDGVWKN